MAGPFKQKYNKSNFPFKSPLRQDPHKDMERIEKDIAVVMGFGDDDSGTISGGGGAGSGGEVVTIKRQPGRPKTEYSGGGETTRLSKEDRIKSRIEKKKKRKTTTRRTKKIKKLEEKLKNL